MSNSNQPNKQDSSNVSPMFTVPPPSITSIPPPPAAAAAFYHSYMQAAAMYAFHQQHQPNFFQNMFSVPPPPLSTANVPTRPPNVIQASLPTNHSQKRSTGKMLTDFQVVYSYF